MTRKRKVDLPLRRDVRFLGEVLGEALVAHEGERLFLLEEEIRKLAILRRRGPRQERPLVEERLRAIVRGLSLEDAEVVTRAFAAYFQLVNLAEQHHRIRRARAYAMDPETPPQRGSIEAILAQACERGVSAARAREALRELRVVLTFTAHPTQATRRTVLEKIYRIAQELEVRDRCALTPLEEAKSLATIREQVGILWQTSEVRSQRPTVASEVKNILWYVENVLWNVIADLPDAIAAAFERVYGEPLGIPVSPVHVHSWAGGDMDGNPNVTASIVEDTLRVHRSRALTLLLHEVERLGRELSQSSRLATPSTELVRSLERDREAMPQIARPVGEVGEPWREKLRFVEARLRASLAQVESRRARATEAAPTPVGLAPTGLAPRTVPVPVGGIPPYTDCHELLDDLGVLFRSLGGVAGKITGARQVARLVNQVRSFGLDVAELELRVVATEAREASDWIEGKGPRTEGAERLLAALRRVGALAREAGHPCRTLILSMATSARDLLAALHCARAAGVWDEERGCVGIDVVPLFETRKDLTAGPEILDEVFSDPLYLEHVRARGHQEVMVGYSDSSKEAGLLAASAELRKIQIRLVSLSRRTGIPLRVFHGRGESVARGGGPAQQAILSLPRGSIAGHYKATEQGEALDHKYARPELAMRTLQLILGGALLHTLDAQEGPFEADEARYDAAFEEIADLGCAAYRALVWEEPAFEAFFRAATPIEEISALPIGSRPARRSAGGLDSLRAIPWVFAWTQNRAILPGWYGVGTAFESFGRRKGAWDLLEEMARSWPFFRAVISNVEMVLAKTDLRIARHYAALAPPETRDAVWPRIEEEHARTVHVVKRLQGVKRLLDDNPPLQRSIDLRNPYVDPMSFVQVELLRRKREGEFTDPVVMLTLNGIAVGMRNTG